MSGLATQLVCWFYAFVFALAVQHKLSQWHRFRASVSAYDIVPDQLLTGFIGLLIVLEVVVVASLVFVQAVGLFLAGILLTVYFIAIAINMGRGRGFIDCGCGDEPTPLSVILLGRNLLLMVVAFSTFYLGLWVGSKEMIAGLVVLSIVMIAGGLYLTLDQLLVNQGKYRRLWLGEL